MNRRSSRRRAATLLLAFAIGGAGADSTPPGDTAAARPFRTNISVSAIASSRPASGGAAVRFAVTVRNDGPEEAGGVVLEAVAGSPLADRLLERRVLESGSGTCDAERLVCAIGRIGTGERVEVVLAATARAVDRPASLGFEFRVVSSAVDTLPCDNRYYSSVFLAPPL